MGLCGRSGTMLAAALSLSTLALAPGSRAAAALDPPVAVVARIAEADGAARLLVDLSGMVTARAFVLDRPDRVIVDLPEVNFQIPPEEGHPAKAGGLIRSFRFGSFAPGKSRIVIDLSAPATLSRASVESIAGGSPSRLTIELDRCDRASFRAAVRRDRLASTGAASVTTAPPPPETRPVVVIDPGHGGIDPGASGDDGATEKVIVFNFAEALAQKLRLGNRYRVVMTRTTDSFVSLGTRVKIAREAGAALFVSVHADTLSDPSVTGATIYSASDRASDAEAARVAAKENKADETAGLETAPESPGVADILFDLTRRETRTYAHLYQRTLAGYLHKVARLNKNPERAAGFKVLQAPDVPSVLLELGYLSSTQDIKMLVSPEWRDKASDVVARSIDAFFAQRKALDGAQDPAPEQGRQHEVVSDRTHS